MSTAIASTQPRTRSRSQLVMWTRIAIYTQEILASAVILVNFFYAWLWRHFSAQVHNYANGTSLHDVAYNETILAGVHIAVAAAILWIAVGLQRPFGWRWWSLLALTLVSLLGTLASRSVGLDNALLPVCFVLLALMATKPSAPTSADVIVDDAQAHLTRSRKRTKKRPSRRGKR